MKKNALASVKEEGFGWMDAVKVLLALIASGFAWTVDNQAGVLSIAAMLMVWAIGYLSRRYGWKPSKVYLTGFLFVVSVILALLFQPVVFPAAPVWAGDVVSFVSDVLVWVGAIVALGGQIFAWATGIYNLLLSKVLKKLEPVSPSS